METSQEEPEIALIDLDGTLADYEGGLRKRLSLLASPGEPEITEKDMSDPPPWIEQRMSLVKRSPGFWRDLERIEDGFRVLERILWAGFNTAILTKGPRSTHSAWTEKVEWCAKHVPDLPVTVGHEKGLVYGRVLFDDYPRYALSWLKHRPRGTVIMLDGPINQGFEHPQVVRVMRPFTAKDDDVLRPALEAAKSR